MPPSRDTGQASLEYVALLAVLGVLLGGALAFSGALPPLARSLSGALRHGICLVSGSICTPGEAAAAGLEPCPLFRRHQQEQGTVSVAVITLQRGDSMVIERLSDGRVKVSFVDYEGAGATVGAGLRLRKDAREYPRSQATSSGDKLESCTSATTRTASRTTGW